MAKKNHKSRPIIRSATEVDPDPVQTTNQLAAAALVVSILGLYFGFGFIGAVLGFVALNQIKTSAGSQKGQLLAKAGIAVGVLSVCMLMLGITGVRLHKPGWKAKNACCMSNLKMLTTSIKLYAEDYDGQLPAGNRWSDAIKPRAHNDNQWFICLEARSLSCGYSFFNKLDMVHITSIAKPAVMPLLFDSTGGWNSARSIEQADARHNGGYNCSFVDGHVKWFAPPKNAPWIHK